MLSSTKKSRSRSDSNSRSPGWRERTPPKTRKRDSLPMPRNRRDHTPPVPHPHNRGLNQRLGVPTMAQSALKSMTFDQLDSMTNQRQNHLVLDNLLFLILNHNELPKGLLTDPKFLARTGLSPNLEISAEKLSNDGRVQFDMMKKKNIFDVMNEFSKQNTSDMSVKKLIELYESGNLLSSFIFALKNNIHLINHPEKPLKVSIIRQIIEANNKDPTNWSKYTDDLAYTELRKILDKKKNEY
jgi:hypothetical protein